MTPPYDILYIIFSFLTYSERARCLRLCRFMKGMTIDRFLGTTISPIQWHGRQDPFYVMVYHPYKEGKTLSHYLSKYHPETDDVKHILHVIESDLL